MEIISITGKTQQKNIRVEKSISGILLQADQAFDDFTNETISVKIETTEGKNIDIIPTIKVKALLEAGQMGEGAIKNSATLCSGLIKLTSGNSFALNNDEAIIITLEGLKSAKTYILDGLESPVINRNHLVYTSKKILAGSDRKEFDVRAFDFVIINPIDALESLEITFDNGVNRDYNKREIDFLARQVNDLVTSSSDSTHVIYSFSDQIMLNMQNATQLDIRTDKTEVDVYLVERIGG